VSALGPPPALVRLEAVLLASVLAVRAHAATGPADVIEEEAELQAALKKIEADEAAAKVEPEAAAPPEEPAAEEEEEAAEEAYEDDEMEDDEEAPAEETVAALATSGGLHFKQYWTKLADGLPTGEDDAAANARRSLFNRLDADMDGSLTLSELERVLPETLGVKTPYSAMPPFVPPLVSAAFEAAKGMADDSLVVEDTGCSVHEFDTLCAYLHAAFRVLGGLMVPSDGASIAAVDQPTFNTLLDALPTAWNLSPQKVQREFSQMDGWSLGAVKGDAVVRWLATAALPALWPARFPPSPGGRANDDNDAEEEEEMLDDPLAEVEEIQEGGPPPPGGLDPVFETTERSNFSTVGDWSGPGGAGGSSERVDTGAAGPSGSDTLGGNSGFGSVKMGFFDASQLDLDDDAGGDTSQLKLKYQQAMAEAEASKQEVARLQAELQASRAAEAAERKKHSSNVRRMLEANEALQAQLRELNGVVEKVVLKEISRHKGGKAGGAKTSARGPQLAPGAKPFR